MRKRFTRTARLVPRSAMRLALYSMLGGCALAWPGLASALGLGEISLHSSLNQPLNADILLSDSAGLDEGDITVGLASPETFAQAGVERSFFLTDLHFTPLFRNGRKVIHVSSSKVVVEPYLNFIVQVTQPAGQVLRTYTLLIDPPGSVALTPPLVATNARPEPVSSVAPMPAPVATPPNPPAAAARRSSAEGATAAKQGAASEELTATAAQNRQLQQSVDTLQAHLQSLEDERSAKDQQLADVQARLAEAQALAAARAAAATPAPASGPATAPGAPAAPLATTPVTPASPAATATAPTAAPAPAPTATPAPTPAPVAPLAVAPETDDLTWLLQLGALAALLLLIAAWVLQRRRQRTAAPVPEFVPVPVVAPVSDDADVLPPMPTAASTAAAARREQAPATDALDAASIYIAYGRFNEALGVLREGLQRQPARRDLRLRILEVLGLQGDAHAYAEEEAALRANGEQDAVLEQTRARFPRLAPAAVALAAGGVLAGAAAAAGGSRAPVEEAPPAAAPPVFDLGMPPQEPLATTATASDLDIDFDALGDLDDLGDLGEPVEQVPVHEPREGDAEEFHLNLDDLSLDADWSAMDPFEAPPPPAGRPAAAAELSLDDTPAPAESLFFSNLRELPEVMELPEEEFLSDFADAPLAPLAVGEDDLDAAFLDHFAEEPVVLPGLEEQALPGLDAADESFELQGDALPDLDELSIDFDSIESQAQAADRLDQARSLLAQGDSQEASWLLHELLQDGDEATREAARQMLAGL